MLFILIVNLMINRVIDVLVNEFKVKKIKKIR